MTLARVLANAGGALCRVDLGAFFLTAKRKPCKAWQPWNTTTIDF